MLSSSRPFGLTRRHLCDCVMGEECDWVSFWRYFWGSFRVFWLVLRGDRLVGDCNRIGKRSGNDRETIEHHRKAFGVDREHRVEISKGVSRSFLIAKCKNSIFIYKPGESTERIQLKICLSLSFFFKFYFCLFKMCFRMCVPNRRRLEAALTWSLTWSLTWRESN